MKEDNGSFAIDTDLNKMKNRGASENKSSAVYKVSNDKTYYYSIYTGCIRSSILLLLRLIGFFKFTENDIKFCVND